MSTSYERFVIGMCIRTPQHLGEVLEVGVARDWFEDPRLADIFVKMGKMDRDGSPIGACELGAEIPDHAGLICELLDEAPIAQNFDYHLNNFRFWSRQRYAIKRLSRLQVAMGDVPSTAGLEGLAGPVFALADELSGNHGVSQQGPQLIADVLQDYVPQLEAKIIDFKAGKATGISTGIRKLNSMIGGGWQNGTLNIIAARTGLGKTTFGVNAILSASSNHPAVFFTVEMSTYQILTKMISNKSEVIGTKIAVGAVSEIEMDGIMSAVRTLHPMPIRIDHSSGGSIEVIETRCRQLHRQGQLKLVFVDYIQLLRASGRFQNRQLELTEITGRLKQLALKLGVPIIAMAQINRQAEASDCPSLHHLKDSGSIEQDSDLVIIIYENEEGRFLNVAKNRFGRTGQFPVDANLAINKFADPKNDHNQAREPT